MAEPQLFVDQRKQFIGRSELVFGDTNIGQTQQLQHIVIAPPDRAQLVFCPASLNLSRKLLSRERLERPAARFEQRGKHIDRRCIFMERVELLAASHWGEPHVMCMG